MPEATIRLGDLFFIETGRETSSSDNLQMKPTIGMGSIGTDGRLLSTPIKSSNTTGLLTEGDLVMAAYDIGGGGIIGRTVYVPNDSYALGNLTFSLRPKVEMASKYYHYLLNHSFKKKLRSKAQGTSQLYLLKREVENLLVPFPLLEKQEATSRLFSLFDERIALQERRVNLLREQKQGYLQKIFTQELRFKREDGSEYPEWERSTLGDIAHYINGYPFKPEDLGIKGKKVIRIKQLLNNSLDGDRTEKVVNPNFEVHDGEIIFSWSGTIAVKRWGGESGILNQHLFRVVVNPVVDKNYAYYALQFAAKTLLTKAHGSTMKHLNRNELLNFEILLPCLEEQTQMGKLVDLLEQRLSGEERKLTLFALQKQSYLQALFSQ